MSFISPKQTKYLSLIAVTLSITVAILTLMGLLAILSANTGQLATLNTDAIIITSPDSGAEFSVNDTVLFTVIFNPSVLEGQATDYYVLAKSLNKIFLQEEGTRLSYNTAFSISRTFTPKIPAEITLRGTMTVDGTDYYNELTVTVIDPTVEKVTTEEITTGIETTSGFDVIPVIFGVFCAICYYYFQKQREEIS